MFKPPHRERILATSVSMGPVEVRPVEVRPVAVCLGLDSLLVVEKCQRA